MTEWVRISHYTCTMRYKNCSSFFFMLGWLFAVPSFVSAAATATPVRAAPAPTPVGESIIQNLAELSGLLGLPESNDPATIITNLIRLALGFIGIIFVVLVLYTGVLVMFSGGNEEQIAKAKKTFFNALIGLIIILMSRSIVEYVVTLLTKVTTGTL